MQSLTIRDPERKSEVPPPELNAWMDECDEADRQRELEYDRDERAAIEGEA